MKPLGKGWLLETSGHWVSKTEQKGCLSKQLNRGSTADMWPRMERRPVRKGQDLQELKSIFTLDPGQSKARERLLGPNMETSSSYLSAGQNTWRSMVPVRVSWPLPRPLWREEKADTDRTDMSGIHFHRSAFRYRWLGLASGQMSQRKNQPKQVVRWSGPSGQGLFYPRKSLFFLTHEKYFLLAF